MTTWFQRIQQPVLFQGAHKKNHYFEGWYYKQVSADMKTVFSVIPGISLTDEDPHAFIQTILYREGLGLSTGYHRFELSAFQFEDEPFQVRIGDNQFSEKGFSLSLAQSKTPNGSELHGGLSANVVLGKHMPIQTSLLSPNVMGFFAYLPFMECYHGLVSMRHDVSGSLSLGGETIDLNGGVGYIEKDWGSSFPKAYIWTQSNHFNVPNLDFMCSIAHIPFMGTAFQGFLCNLYFEGKEYRFATYNGTKLKDLVVGTDSFELTLVSFQYKLLIQGKMDVAEVLISPKNGAMTGQIKEGLSGRLTLLLTNKRGETIINASSHCCGMEVVLRRTYV